MRRQKKQPHRIGRAELEVLSFIHDHHPTSVRDVAEHLAKTRGVVRTTVLNMIARLTAKGYLSRKRIDGIYQYSPSIPKPQLLSSLVREFVHGALGGSLSPFVAYLSNDADVSDEELAELKSLVRELDRRKSEGR